MKISKNFKNITLISSIFIIIFLLSFAYLKVDLRILFSRIIYGNYLTKFDCNSYPDKQRLDKILLNNSNDFLTFLNNLNKIAKVYVDCKTFPENVCYKLKSNASSFVTYTDDSFILVSLLEECPIRCKSCKNINKKAVLRITVTSNMQAKKILKMLDGSYKNGTQNFKGIPVVIINN